MNPLNPDSPKVAAPRQIKELFEQHNLGTFYLSNTLTFLHALIRLGVKPREDGWRKYATAFLRTEDSRFTLAVFRLKLSSTHQNGENPDEAKRILLTRLAEFFKLHPHLWNTRLVWSRKAANIRPNEHLDLVWADFDPQGNLSQLHCLFDADQAPSFDEPDPAFTREFIQAYNQTRLCGHQRPYFLLKAVRDGFKNSPKAKSGVDFAQRIMDCVFVHFETIPPDKRFDFPDFSLRCHPGGGAFNLWCRLQPDGKEADLWFSGNHALADGNPVVEAIDDLKKEWGVQGAMLYPSPAPDPENYTLFRSSFNDTGKDLVTVQQFLSFTHLIECRAMLNEKYRAQLDEPITIAGMVLWGLSNQPLLKGIKLTVAVDVPPCPDPGKPRTLGFVTSKPGSFLYGSEREKAFIDYQNYLNRAFHTAKKREDLSYAMMLCQTLVPVEAYQTSLALVPQAITDIGGIVTLTIIPHADFCLAPGDDSKDICIAISNFNMPTEDGQKAGVVSIKTLKKDADSLREATFNAITRWEV